MARTLTPLLTLAGLISCASTPEPVVPRTEGPPPPIDYQALQEAATETLRRMESEPVTWTATKNPDGEFRMVVQVQSAPPLRQDKLLLVQTDGRSTLLATFVYAEDVWYVDSGEGFLAHRPYEATLPIPGWYLPLNRADFRVVDQPEEGLYGEHVATKDGIAYFENDLPPTTRANLQKMVADTEEQLAGAEATEEGRAKLRASIDRLKKQLATREVVAIDLQTGVFVRVGREINSMKIDGPHFQSPSQALTAPEQIKVDLTASAVAAGHGDLLVVNWCDPRAIGTTECGPGAHIVDLGSAALRRVPYQGHFALGGGFFPDDRRVMVAGATDEGRIALFSVDLETGEQTTIAERQGNLLLPSVSPDGTKVVAGELVGMAMQVIIVDLESGESSALLTMSGLNAKGKPSWSPDSDAVFYALAGEDGVYHVTRLGLDGTQTRVVPGDRVLALHKQRRLLVREPEGGTWFTCRLDGKRRRPLGDGLAHYTTPTEAHDGEALIMQKKGKAAGLARVSLKDGSVEPLDLGPGLWTAPWVR